jgi:hypothetical protein
MRETLKLRIINWRFHCVCLLSLSISQYIVDKILQMESHPCNDTSINFCENRLVVSHVQYQSSLAFLMDHVNENKLLCICSINKELIILRSEVVISVNTKITIFCVAVTPCSLVERQQNFKETVASSFIADWVSTVLLIKGSRFLWCPNFSQSFSTPKNNGNSFCPEDGGSNF